MERCLSFLRDTLGVQVTLPLSESQLHLYIAHLHTEGYKHATVLNHVSAISHFHKIHGVFDPTTTYTTTKMLTGVRNSQHNIPDARRPITHNILMRMMGAIRTTAIDDYQLRMYRSLFSLMYYACLRISEVSLTATSDHNIQLSQVSMKPDHKSFQLQFRSYKHCVASDFQLHVTATSSLDCPVKLMLKYLVVRGRRSGPLYQINGMPLRRHQIISMLNSTIKYLKLPEYLFNTHSFRIGRTTDLAAANVPHTTIKHIGRWQSNAYLKYVRPVTTTVP